MLQLLQWPMFKCTVVVNKVPGSEDNKDKRGCFCAVLVYFPLISKSNIAKQTMVFAIVVGFFRKIQTVLTLDYNLARFSGVLSVFHNLTFTEHPSFLWPIIAICAVN